MGRVQFEGAAETPIRSLWYQGGNNSGSGLIKHNYKRQKVSFLPQLRLLLSPAGPLKRGSMHRHKLQPPDKSTNTTNRRRKTEKARTSFACVVSGVVVQLWLWVSLLPICMARVRLGCYCDNEQRAEPAKH